VNYNPGKMVRLSDKSRLPHMISLRLEDEVYELLRQEAEKEDRNISHMIRVLVKEALKARKASKKGGK